MSDAPPVGLSIEAQAVIEWRLEVLVAAGYRHPEACDLALRPEVDLHRAVDLAGRCGPDLAFRIVS
jgi:hypothetical protein